MFSCKIADIVFRSKFLANTTLGISEQNLKEFLFFFFLFLQKIFHLFLGPLYMLSTCFHAKTSKLYSDQNSWPIGPKGIFEPGLTEFFFLIAKDFSIYLQVFV